MLQPLESRVLLALSPIGGEVGLPTPGDDGFVDSLWGGAGHDVFITLDGVIDHLFGDGGDDSANADDEDVLTSIVQG